MKGSITFRFCGDPGDYHVDISQQGELDHSDLEVVEALLHEDIIKRRAIKFGEIIGLPPYVWMN